MNIGYLRHSKGFSVTAIIPVNQELRLLINILIGGAVAIALTHIQSMVSRWTNDEIQRIRKAKQRMLL